MALSLTAISIQLERHIFSDYRSYSATAAAGRKDWRCEKEEKRITQVYIFSVYRKKNRVVTHGDMFVSVLALRY